MSLSKIVTASVLGLVSLQTGTLAKRDLTEARPTHLDDLCKKEPHLKACEDSPPPPVPEAEPDTTAGDGELDAEGPAEAEVGGESKEAPPDPHSGKDGKGGNGSIASCFAYAAAGGEIGGETFAKAVTGAAAYACGDGSADAYAAAEATATLFAQAVATASVYCEASGDTEFYAEANAHAVQHAEAWLVAYAEAFASAGVCNVCDAYAESFGYVEKYVFLEAVASASAKLEGYTQATDLKAFLGYVHDYEVTVKEAVATAYASALANAAKYYDGHGCYAWVNTGGCIYTPHEPEVCFDCIAHAASDSFIYEIDAVATAWAGAATYTCGDHVVTEAEADVVAKALAEATAIAISEVYVSCITDDGTFACAEASTYIVDSAHAVAKAFADAWAVGLTCDDTCYVDAETSAKAVGEVLATAASAAYEHVCGFTEGHWSAYDLQIDIESKHIKAIAQAWALSIQSTHPNICLAAAGSTASVN